MNSISFRKSDRTRLGTLHRLRNLCCTQLPLLTIAPSIFDYLNFLIPHDAYGMALTYPNGEPYILYYKNLNPQSMRYVQENTELFLNLKTESHIRWLNCPMLPKVGNLLRPDDPYFHSLTYQMIVRQSGLHHTLDLRLERNHIPAGGITLYRRMSQPFQLQDHRLLEQAGVYIEYALNNQMEDGDDVIESDQALLIVNSQNELVMMTDAAKDLLNLFPIHYEFWEPYKALPKSCYQVINELKYGQQIPKLSLTIPNGILTLRAEWLSSQNTTDTNIALYLKRSLPRSLIILKKLEALDLSPRECQVAFSLITGMNKSEILQKLSISPAVFKDCVKSVYQSLNVHSVSELITFASQWTTPKNNTFLS